MAIFIGSGTAVCTPFDENGDFSYEQYEQIINYQIAKGADAIVSCGTTGENSTLDTNEHVEVVRAAVEIVKKLTSGKKKIPVIAGAGGNDTKHCIMLGQELVKSGVDACMYVTPYYNKTSQKGLVEHFSLLASKIDVPIVLYNIQARTGLNMAPETLSKLSSIDNIQAVKEASGNIVQVAEIAELCGDKLDIYAGNDDYVVPILSLGGKGVISTVANIIPSIMSDMVHKYLNGDVSESRRIQLYIMPLVRAVFKDVNPMPIKEAMNIIGFNAGKCRMPLSTVDDSLREELKKQIAHYGIKLEV